MTQLGSLSVGTSPANTKAPTGGDIITPSNTIGVTPANASSGTRTVGVGGAGINAGGNGTFGPNDQGGDGGANSGGGGGGTNRPTNRGGNGGSGYVAIRVLTADWTGTQSNASVSTSGDYTILKWTGNGSFVV